MTPLEKLKKISERLKVPFAVDKYEGTKGEFTVYSLDGLSGDAFADDKAQVKIAEVTFLYVLPASMPYSDKIFQISDMMQEEDFTCPIVDVFIDKNSEKYRIIEFKAETIFLEED